MADDIRITSPVKVVSDSQPHVAFDLMKIIADWDNITKEKKKDYWLRLYRQCYKATSGHVLKSILDESE